MKTETILSAIAALDRSRESLRCGMDSIPVQMRIADDCSKASARLQIELVHEVPDVKIKEAA